MATGAFAQEAPLCADVRPSITYVPLPQNRKIVKKSSKLVEIFRKAHVTSDAILEFKISKVILSHDCTVTAGKAQYRAGFTHRYFRYNLKKKQ